MEARVPSRASLLEEELVDRRRGYSLLLGRVLFGMLLWLVIAGPVLAEEAGRVVSIVGRAEVLQAGQWQPVKLGEALMPGEVMRTGAGSRVAVQLLNKSQIKINANSQLELKQVAPPVRKAAIGFMQTLLRLFSGEVWVRSYVEPFEIETTAAISTIRGTELNLAIEPAEATRLTVLEGVVEFRNPQGSVFVAAKEQAVAKPGEAPRKTVLLNPLDAVQWSLYYPGIFSYRDYPLSGIKPVLLRERLAVLERRIASAPQDVNAILELGEVLFDLGRRMGARKEFEKALTLAPRDSRAHTGLGWVYLETGEVKAALNQFRQAQPSILGALVGMANALYRLNRFEEALEVIVETKRRFPKSPMLWTQAALIYLLQGQVTEALAELDHTLALDPGYALAHGLHSNIYLIQNQKERALEAAQRAVTANPFSPSAYLDLSLVKQAEFKLEEALQAARKVIELDPDNPQALIQVSRLLFGREEVEKAFELAEQARHLAPQDPVVSSTWGFLQLARANVNEAIAAFDQAIVQDSTRGEPHLGKGLALFRRGKTEEGEKEMRIAALLEPKVSLYHSYLGKALYEVKQDRLAEQQLAIAKELDPRDPTPHFYDAIQKQSVNRPVEALQDLQKAIELNDNRAVYRSRLLLDQDLAVRSTSLGRIYRDLGFEQHALVKGWKSLTVDPANHSAHRLLADSYSALPRYGIARVSELLQSQLLQPINLTPVQPQLAERDLLILEGTGPADPAFNEFNPFFVRDRFALQASGIVGTQNTFGDEVVQSGVWRNLSYSLGQFHYETDGFRKNNDLERDIYNAFFQANMSPKTSVQAELRHVDTQAGDRRFRFLPDTSDFTLRTALKTDTARLGFHYVFTPSSDIIASFIYKSTDSKLQEGTDVRVRFEDTLDENAYLFEGQHLFRSQYLNLISGLGYYTTVDHRAETTVVVRDMPFFEEVIEDNIRRTNLYLYSQINYLTDISMTLGISADFFEGMFGARNQVNPKFGLSWSPFPGTMLRAAAYRVLEQGLSIAQTIEPTHVAGFNQYFGAPREERPIPGFSSGIRAWRYGVGIDQKFSPNFSGGGELSKRDLQVPGEVNGEPREEDWEEYLARTYFYWTPHPWLAASLEYQFERFERGNLFGAGTGIGEVDTHRVPVGIRIFHPSGLSAGINATYINQEGEFARAVFDRFRPFESGAQQFWVVDAELQYRLPNRLGFVTFGVKNLLDEDFQFQETDPAVQTIQRDRLFFTRATLAF